MRFFLTSGLTLTLCLMASPIAYANAQAEQDTGPASEADNPAEEDDDDIVDAEFEDVEDDKA